MWWRFGCAEQNTALRFYRCRNPSGAAAIRYPELADSTFVEMCSANCSLPPKHFAVRRAYSARVRYATTNRNLVIMTPRPCGQTAASMQPVVVARSVLQH